MKRLFVFSMLLLLLVGCGKKETSKDIVSSDIKEKTNTSVDKEEDVLIIEEVEDAAEDVENTAEDADNPDKTQSVTLQYRDNAFEGEVDPHFDVDITLNGNYYLIQEDEDEPLIYVYDSNSNEICSLTLGWMSTTTYNNCMGHIEKDGLPELSMNGYQMFYIEHDASPGAVILSKEDHTYINGLIEDKESSVCYPTVWIRVNWRLDEDVRKDLVENASDIFNVSNYVLTE